MAEVRNLQYTLRNNIDCEVLHPTLGWIPYTASADDVEEFGRELYQEIKDRIDIAPYVPVDELPVRRMIAKSIVQARVINAGKMPDAFAMLNANPIYFARWFAPDQPAVYFDDPDAVGLVQALGLDPAVVLAPETQEELEARTQGITS